jgi:beta-galactosidase
MNKKNSQFGSVLCRRDFVRSSMLSTAALAALPSLGSKVLARAAELKANGTGEWTLPLEQDWLFGGEWKPDAASAAFDDSQFEKITLPHCATKLSWQDWRWEDWQKIFCYRRHFSLPKTVSGSRTFVDFEGVMVGAEPSINGHTLPKHLGGYLPFSYEITEFVKPGENILAVAVDSRWSNVPPQGATQGPQRVDYLEAGGIHRPIKLRVVPQVFVQDVFAKPLDVLTSNRRLDVLCSVDAAKTVESPLQLKVALVDGGRTLASGHKELRLEKAGATEITITLSDLAKVQLWDLATPKLYDVVTSLSVAGKPMHEYRVRTGFREARFEKNGFFLNGRRVQLFGLNRHEVYPYVGYAMPTRVKRRDAEILKHDFNCNFVRCSHYPQSPAFLDACDELGLLVWQEVPGWGYLGDDAWKELLVRDAHDMIVRDRNRPSIVIWGTRANETANDVELYRRTRTLAKTLDGTRATSGSMTSASRRTWEKDWNEDVFAFDEYHATPEHTVSIGPPLPDIPYMLAEAVGQYNYATGKGFDSYYRRSGDPATQPLQALRHAEAHSKAAAYPRHCGVVAWCGFEYASLVNGYHRVKYPGVADVFRIPKLGASFYLSQGDPKKRVVIEPDFHWDFGEKTPKGPGLHAAIFSNCDRLEIFINGKQHADLQPDTKGFPYLTHAPFFVDLEMNGEGHPELRIDGYLGSRVALSRTFSSDPAKDQLLLQVDDSEILGDGVDATRLVFKITDKYGANRAYGVGEVKFQVQGPGTILGDNPFNLTDTGGVAAVWIKSKPRSTGRIIVEATHVKLGTKRVTVQVSAART